MIRKKDRKKLIESFEEMLKEYVEKLRCEPDNFFYKGLVKNTREHLEELYEEAKLEMPQHLSTAA